MNDVTGRPELRPGAHRPAVLAFLKATLEDGAKAVCDLELKARSAGLLSEGQRITDAKVFKWAKKTLRIRSTRIGFGSAGQWCWVLSHDPGLDVAEPAGHLSMDPPTAVTYGADLSSTETAAKNAAELDQTLGPEPQLPVRIGVQQDWIDGFSSLDRHRAPAHVPLHRWQLFIGDCEQFLDIWGATAADMGWSAETLFGCAIAQPLAHLRVAGLLWALRGGKLIRLYQHSASIECTDGSNRVFNRRTTYGAQVVLPWRLGRPKIGDHQDGTNRGQSSSQAWS